jgi:hypothetical protein
MAPDDADPADAASTGDDGDEPDDLLDLVGRYAATGQPIDVMGLASATLSILFHPEPPADLDRDLIREQVLEQMLTQYVDAGTSDSLTFANVLAALVAEETLRRRLFAALDGSEDEVPRWVAGLAGAELEQTTVVRDLFDDDEWLLAGVRLADDSRFAFRIEIDHDADGTITDAMLMPTTVDEVCDRLRSGPGADEVAITDVTPGDFVDLYTEAVELTDARPEPIRTETWPSCRPAIEWALRRHGST